MRMLMNIKLPNDAIGAAIKDGSAEQKIRQILEMTGPEAVYFTEQGGQRGAVMIVDVDDPSKFPALSEPWFLAFNASVEFKIAMTPEDLKKAGLGEIGKRWA